MGIGRVEPRRNPLGGRPFRLSALSPTDRSGSASHVIPAAGTATGGNAPIAPGPRSRRGPEPERRGAATARPAHPL
ncbi:hypothetical protein NFA_26910 [Nocardia farcinica IFM 10152]|uniref:Uncharacterized protein n=1 Tax=Nocardia farcinica (strain IFM 10152) TaxID=247156 RepID=Q5YWA3_NOCFA|nr:hypothetical protein NFA_26910 [Nocardia farcinica IFM 10152]